MSTSFTYEHQQLYFSLHVIPFFLVASSGLYSFNTHFYVCSLKQSDSLLHTFYYISKSPCHSISSVIPCPFHVHVLRVNMNDLSLTLKDNLLWLPSNRSEVRLKGNNINQPGVIYFQLSGDHQ